MKPKILLLDEPLSALDGVHQRKNQADRQRLPSDNHHRYPRSKRSLDTVRKLQINICRKLRKERNLKEYRHVTL